MSRIFSSIRPSLKRFMLFRGTLIGGVGALILFFSGTFLSEATLETWGLALFFLSFALIAWGLIPYRRLMKLEESPYELVETETDLILVRKNENLITIPLASIDHMDYYEKGRLYGIRIQLKEKVVFLPYFTKRAISAIIAPYDE